MAKMTIGGSTTGSISAGSVHDINIDVVEVPCTPVNIRKRKRRSFPESPEGPTDEVKAEIEGLLNYVPKIDKAFNITNKIGEGTFSSVYLARVKCCGPKVKQQFALKHIIPTSHPERIMGELQCLHMIGGKDNVMGMKLSLRERDHVVIVMPYFPHDSFHVFVRKMTLSEMREYMRNLLLALRRVHQFDIIHRDIKPSNFLCNRKLNKYALVDFGLAQKVPGSKCLLSSSASRKTPRTLPIVQQKTRVPSLEKTTEIKRLHSQSVPRLIELDPNTFNRTLPQKPNSFNPSFIKKPQRNTLVKTFQQPTILNQKRVLPKKQAPSTTKQRHGSTRLSSGRGSSSSVKTCNCFGLLQVCNVCTSRSGQVAPRAGTPGFRSPEVLLKYPNQTTAVDMWAAGVIFLSILTGRYPFFKAQDDMTALAQIMSIVGTEEMKKAAREYGKEITSSVRLPAMNLKAMCEQLRKDNTNCHTPPSDKKTRTTMPTTNEKQKTKRRRIMDSHTSCDNTPSTSPASSQHKARSTRSPPSRVEKLVVPATRKGCIPDLAYDLLQRLLDLNPNTRISAEEALKHPFINTVQ